MPLTIQWYKENDIDWIVEEEVWEKNKPQKPTISPPVYLMNQYQVLGDHQWMIDYDNRPPHRYDKLPSFPEVVTGIQWSPVDDTPRLFEKMNLWFLVKKDGVYGYYKDDDFVSLGTERPSSDDFKEFGMTNYGSNISKKFLNDLTSSKEYKIINYHEVMDTQLNISVNPTEALLLANGDLSLKSVDNIDFFKLNYTRVEGAVIKMIVSSDEGETWQTFDGGSWIDIEPTVKEVGNYGIPVSQFDIIPSDMWNELRQYSDTIRFGYYLKHTEKIDFAKIHALNAQFDMTGEWFSANKGTDYKYSYPDNSTIKVTILKNGDYKINY